MVSTVRGVDRLPTDVSSDTSTMEVVLIILGRYGVLAFVDNRVTTCSAAPDPFVWVNPRVRLNVISTGRVLEEQCCAPCTRST